MAPKIEVVSEDAVAEPQRASKKNPFASKRTTTVKREAKDVYPQRKGLNKPQFTSTAPLDLLFAEIEQIVDGPLESLSLEVLHSRLFTEDQDPFVKTYSVAEKLLGYIKDIQRLANDAKPDDKNLIGISLHDIKTFSKVVNLVLIHGVYPALSAFKIGIPFEKRRLLDYQKRPIKIVPLPEVNGAKSYVEKFSPHEKLLTLMYDNFKEIFSVESDVKELLIKGTGYSDFMTIALALITVPYFDRSKRSRLVAEYESTVIQLPVTYELFQNYSLLLSSPSPAFFKQFVMAKLLTLHYDAPRKDGLLTLCEFVLNLRENEEVNIEKFDHVANVVLLKPKTISTVDYFTNIGFQAFDLLVNINKPVVTSCITYVIEKLWEKNKLVTQDFFVKRIWQTFSPEASSADVIVGEAALNNGINVILSLTKKGLASDLSTAIFAPILVSLWSYFTFAKEKKKPSEIMQNIMVSYFTIMNDSDSIGNDESIFGLDTISKNLLAEGGDHWEYSIGPNDMLQITSKKSTVVASDSKETKVMKFLGKLDTVCEYLSEILTELDDSLIQRLFVSVLKRWLKLNEKKTLEDSSASENPFFMLMDLRLLEKLGNKFSDNLAKTPLEMLQMVESFLLLYKRDITSTSVNNHSQLHIKTEDSDDEDSDDEENFDNHGELSETVLPVILELLSAILSESVVIDEPSCDSLRRITGLLKDILNHRTSVPENVSSSLESLHSRIEMLLNNDTPVSTTKDQHEKILKRAIASLNDPLVPIRAHGLFLLRQLIESKSEVVTIDFVVNLHLVQLKDPEPFVYLNVIKGLESLIEWDQKQVLPVLVAIYTNNEDSTDLDERLKIGEVLLRYIQNANELFSGPLARLVVEATLGLIRRPADETKNIDDRLRMSAMSLLGVCCNTNPIGIIDNLENALDCAVGILQLETDQDRAIMRRSAIVLIHDLIIGTSNKDDIPFPVEYQLQVLRLLRYVETTDTDLLVREQAQTVLLTVEELAKLSFAPAE